MKITRFAALLAVVPLLVACGGEDEPKPSDGSEGTDGPSAVEGNESGGDACSLLTTDEVSEAVGAEVGDGLPTGNDVATGGSQSTCVWTGVENVAATATLTVYTEASAADSVKDADSLPLPEVGNDAFIGPFASVWAYAGDGSFTTQWYDFGASDKKNLPSSIALAQLYLEKL